MNVLEKKLENITEDFNGRNVQIMFSNFINGKIDFDNININYDKERGYLRFLSNENCLEFNLLDIKSVNNTKEKIEISLDNSQKIKILGK